MRVVHAAALTAAALLLASITSAQGLGDAAAREREKRKATPAKPTKVYTDQEVASTPASAWSDTGSQETPAEGGSADGAETAGGAGAAPAAADDLTPEQKAAAEEEKAAAAEAEARAKAEADWRDRLEQARKAEAAYTDRISRLEAELGDLSSISFGANRARKMSLLDEGKQKLAETQANIAALEEEGRRNAYR